MASGNLQICYHLSSGFLVCGMIVDVRKAMVQRATRHILLAPLIKMTTCWDWHWSNKFNEVKPNHTFFLIPLMHIRTFLTRQVMRVDTTYLTFGEVSVPSFIDTSHAKSTFMELLRRGQHRHFWTLQVSIFQHLSNRIPTLLSIWGGSKSPLLHYL